MPLEIVLRTARALWAEAQVIDSATGKVTIDTEKAKEAAVIADRALAYCHARINAIDAPTKPVVEEENSLLEDARRLAYTITMGIRERSRLLPKKATT